MAWFMTQAALDQSIRETPSSEICFEMCSYLRANYGFEDKYICRMKKTCKFSKLMEAFENDMEMNHRLPWPRDEFTFITLIDRPSETPHSRMLEEWDTPMSIGLENGSLIDVYGSCMRELHQAAALRRLN